MKRKDENHSFNIHVAMMLDGNISKAIILKEIYGWCVMNKASNKNMRIDLPWTYMSARGYAEKFPYFTERSISRWLKELVNDGWLYSHNFNKFAYDRTIWYTINYKRYDMAIDSLCMSICHIDEWKRHISESISQFDKSKCLDGEPIPSSTTNTNTSTTIIKEAREQVPTPPLEDDVIDISLKTEPKEERKKVPPKKESVEDAPYYFEVTQVLAALSEKTGAKYRIPEKKSLLLRYGPYQTITARIKEGFVLEDLLSVLESKCKEWLSSDKMCKYLVPATLFSKSKFESYLASTSIKPTNYTNNGNQTNNLHPETAKTIGFIQQCIDTFDLDTL